MKNFWVLVAFALVIFASPSGSAPTLGDSGVGGGGSLGATPSCFESSLSRDPLVTSNITTSINDTGDPWVLMVGQDSSSFINPSSAELTSKFTKTTDAFEWTSLDPRLIRMTVGFNMPSISAGAGNMEITLTYGACSLDYAVSGDPKIGMSRVAVDSARYLGGTGMATFDLPALGCFAVIGRTTTATSDALVIKAWSVLLRQVSTPARPCT